MANAKKIIGIILLVIGLFIIIRASMFSIVYTYIYIWPSAERAYILPTFFIGVACIFPGLVLLMTSRKKREERREKREEKKSPDKSIT